MSKIWLAIILISLYYGVITGRMELLNAEILAIPLEAVKMTVTLISSACFWNGFMYILQSVGIIERVSKILKPFLRLIFPHLDDKIALECISSNIAANMFGLGFAATPSGLKGIKRLQEISPRPKDEASDEMITFLVLNTSGVTLIPTTVIAIRQSLGSTNPTDFILVGIMATIFASIGGLVADRMLRK